MTRDDFRILYPSINLDEFLRLRIPRTFECLEAIISWEPRFPEARDIFEKSVCAVLDVLMGYRAQSRAILGPLDELSTRVPRGQAAVVSNLQDAQRFFYEESEVNFQWSQNRKLTRAARALEDAASLYRQSTERLLVELPRLEANAILRHEAEMKRILDMKLTEHEIVISCEAKFEDMAKAKNDEEAKTNALLSVNSRMSTSRQHNLQIATQKADRERQAKIKQAQDEAEQRAESQAKARDIAKQKLSEFYAQKKENHCEN